MLFRAYGGDAERVHDATLRAIHRVGQCRPRGSALAALWARHRQPVTVAGIEFPGRVGLAAGMDKDGVGVRAWAALGFGHAELGTVTAQAQPGNEQPRLFRLAGEPGHPQPDGVQQRRRRRPGGHPRRAGVRRGNRAVGIPLGISIGKTKMVPLAAAAEDYLCSLRILAPYADYLAVNVSSPNTPGLRTLQDARHPGRTAGRDDAPPPTCRSSSSSPRT